MARGRMISKAISLDEQVNALSDDTARLLFTWLITHLDCEGRGHGDAVTVKSIVFPRRKISTQKVENYLKELAEKKLIARYFVNGNQYLFAINFEKHQTGLRKDKESPSQIPPFTPELGRSEVGKGLTQVKDKVKVKDKEETKVKEEDKEESLVRFSKSIKQVIFAYQENILLGGTVPEDIENELKISCRRYSPDWVYDAIKESLAQNHPHWGYIGGILRRWSKYGKKAG